MVLAGDFLFNFFMYSSAFSSGFLSYMIFTPIYNDQLFMDIFNYELFSRQLSMLVQTR